MNSLGTLVRKMDAHLEAVGDVSDGGRLGQHGYPKKRRGMHRLGPRMPAMLKA